MSPARAALDSIQVQIEQPTAADRRGRVIVKSTSSPVVLDICLDLGPAGGLSVEAYSYETGHRVEEHVAHYPSGPTILFTDGGERTEAEDRALDGNR